MLIIVIIFFDSILLNSFETATGVHFYHLQISYMLFIGSTELQSKRVVLSTVFIMETSHGKHETIPCLKQCNPNSGNRLPHFF